jgi:hypothetical protein
LRDRNSARDRHARRRRARAGARASAWPTAADAALGADLARRTIAVDGRTGRSSDTTSDARACSYRNAHARRATIQLQLFRQYLGYGMGGHCGGVQLLRGDLGCHWQLHQLHNKHAAVTVHPARTISAQRRQQSIFWYAIFRHAVQYAVFQYDDWLDLQYDDGLDLRQHRTAIRCGNVEFIGCGAEE